MLRFCHLRFSHYATVLLVLMLVTVLSALGMQYLGGFIPCKLCLQERWPYYISVPLMALALVLIRLRSPAVVIRLLFFAVFVLMAGNVALSIYHAGVEWGWWQGPVECSGATPVLVQDTRNLLAGLDKARPVPCDKAALKLFGLSLAGWNALASLFYALLALAAAVSRRKPQV